MYPVLWNYFMALSWGLTIFLVSALFLYDYVLKYRVAWDVFLGGLFAVSTIPVSILLLYVSYRGGR